MWENKVIELNVKHSTKKYILDFIFDNNLPRNEAFNTYVREIVIEFGFIYKFLK